MGWDCLLTVLYVRLLVSRRPKEDTAELDHLLFHFLSERYDLWRFSSQPPMENSGTETLFHLADMVVAFIDVKPPPPFHSPTNHKKMLLA